ncbi:hypothetical protein Plhal304r1_c065g0152511 [Plasmopara halstedii]
MEKGTEFESRMADRSERLLLGDQVRFVTLGEGKVSGRDSKVTETALIREHLSILASESFA